VPLGAIALISVLLLFIAFVVVVVLSLRPRNYRVLHQPYRGDRLPDASETLLQRYRLARDGRAPGTEIAALRQEREEYGYEAAIRSRPGLLAVDLEESVGRGYAVQVSRRFWTAQVDVAFIELPELPETPLGATPPKSILDEVLDAIDEVVRPVVYSPKAAKSIVDEEAPTSLSYEVGRQRLIAYVQKIRAGVDSVDTERLRALAQFEELLLDTHLSGHTRPYREKLDAARKLAARAKSVMVTDQTHAELAKQAVAEVLAGQDSSPDDRAKLEALLTDELDRQQRKREQRVEAEKEK
jgi:hypothetical protein